MSHKEETKDTSKEKLKYRDKVDSRLDILEESQKQFAAHVIAESKGKRSDEFSGIAKTEFAKIKTAIQKIDEHEAAINEIRPLQKISEQLSGQVTEMTDFVKTELGKIKTTIQKADEHEAAIKEIQPLLKKVEPLNEQFS